MIDPRSVATLGIGYGPRHVARIGLLIAAELVSPGNAGPKRRARAPNYPFVAPRAAFFDIDSDDDEIVTILSIVSHLL